VTAREKIKIRQAIELLKSENGWERGMDVLCKMLDPNYRNFFEVAKEHPNYREVDALSVLTGRENL